MASSKTKQDDLDFFGQVGKTFKLIGPSWEALRFNLYTFILVTLIPMIIVAISFAAVIASFTTNSGTSTKSTLSPFFIVAFALIGLIVACIFLPATVLTQLKSAKGIKITFNEALDQSRKYILRYAGLVVLIALSVVIGAIIFIIPGILAAFFFSMSAYILIDKNTGIREAMKRSFRLVKAHWVIILSILLVNICVSIVSYVPIIGTLISAVLYVAYFCMPAIVYSMISKK